MPSFSSAIVCFDDRAISSFLVRFVHHKYSNPVWSSDWNIGNFTYALDIDRRYPRDGSTIFAVTPDGIQGIADQLAELESRATAIRTPDREAQKETRDVLAWFRKVVCEQGHGCILDAEPF